MTLIKYESDVDDRQYPFQAVIIDVVRGLVIKSPYQYAELFSNNPSLRVWGNAQTKDIFDKDLEERIRNASSLDEMVSLLPDSYLVLKTPNANQLRKEFGL